MKIHRVHISMTKLRTVPEHERTLFVLLGHVVNEINVLNKTFYLATQFEEEPRWRVHAHISQSLVFARALVGKLNEGWELLQKGYFKSQLSREYDKHLDSEAKSALDNLKRYFGRENLVSEIRNRFAFHYSLPDAKAALDRDLDDDEMLMYLADDNGNTLYYFSEYVINTGLLEAIESDAPDKALARLMTESAQVVRWFNDFAGGVMTRVVDQYFLGADGKLPLESIEIGRVLPRA